MTLNKDRNPRKRAPMSSRAMWWTVVGAVAVLAFVLIVVAVSGRSFF